MNPQPVSPFHLRRWFAGLSAVVIGLIAVANAWVVSSFLTRQLFQREAAVSREFVQNLLATDGARAFLAQPGNPALQPRFQDAVAPLGRLRDVLRANVYGRERQVLWSSDAKLAGQRFVDNDELDEAMRGELVVHAGHIGPDERGKPEHQGLSPAAAFFVETYIPVLDPGSGTVLGVVELYKAPQALTDAIREGQRQVALAALAGALALFITLYGLVHRAERTMRQQQQQLLQARTLAATGELAAAVAHNIRNPLASIRSSAELALEAPEEFGVESARDIVREVDRISARITELLRLSTPTSGQRQRVDLPALLQRCVADHRETFARRRQTLAMVGELPALQAWGDAAQLEQVLHSVLDNASEAMAEGQACRVQLAALPRKRVAIDVADDGPGPPPGDAESAFEPFFTTKPRGLGLGLTLSRRIVQRWGGSLALRGGPDGRGAVLRIELPQA